jgi:hypothetical protein
MSSFRVGFSIYKAGHGLREANDGIPPASRRKLAC